MSKKIKSFKEPIYITRPLLPNFDEFQQKIKEIFDSKILTNNGIQLKNFEKKLREFLGVKNVSVFCNGTLALQLAYKALELKGEVITTPFTFPATPHSLVWSGLQPVFCDIEENTFNIDPHKIELLITDKTSAIMPVHVFGNPCNVKRIQEIADKYNLKVIYDAAHSFGVEVGGIPIGNFGDISMFSFHATKLFHTLEGGGLTFKDNRLKEKLYFLKNFGIKSQKEVVSIGTNAKMNEIQAAVGILLLGKVQEEIDKRKHLTNLYRKRLKNIKGIKFSDDIADVKHNYQYFVVLIDKKRFGLSRDRVCGGLKLYNVFARKYFYPLCSQSVCYNHLPSSKAENLPVAKKVAEQVLCLPLYGKLQEEDINKICDIIESL